MKILHYIPSIDESSGGVGAYIQLLSHELGKLCELHVLTHQDNNERVLENCTIHYIPYKWLPWNNCKKEFIKILNKINPDIFHTNCCWLPLSAMTAIWAKSKGYKVVYSPHGMLEPYSISRYYWRKKLPAILLFQRKGVAVCDMVHATAESEQNNLLALNWNKNVCVIPNCVRIDEISNKFDSEYLKNRNFKRSNQILFLSRVHPKKGLEILIYAVARLKERLKDYNIIIAGAGEEIYISQLLKLAKSFGVENMLKFKGPVYGTKKWDLYQQSDLFILPTYSENFGIVVAESLACGVPVITTKGTPWQELQSYNCGWWSDVSVEGIVEALNDFLNKTDDDLKLMGENGRNLIESRYDSHIVAKQFISLYNQLVSNYS